MKTFALLFALSLSLFFSFAACETYEPPPGVALEGLASGLLADPRAPLVIDFGMPIDPSSVHLKVAFDDTDIDGNLPDERADPTDLRLILRRDEDLGDLAVTASFESGDATLRLVPSAALPVGPKLVLLVESGLRAKDGRERNFRTRLPFSYTVNCPAIASATTFQSGTYFLLLQVDKPIGTQIQIFGEIEVNPKTGAFVGQFTNADRNLNGARCPTPCGSADACRLLPGPPACVAPSTAAGTVDEFPDWVPNATPPTGYSFEVHGCAVDDGSAVDMLTAPATMVVQQPAVTVQGLAMTAQFAPAADGVVRATGSLVADAVFLGTNTLGAGKGTMTAVRLRDDQVPPGVPKAGGTP